MKTQRNSRASFYREAKKIAKKLFEKGVTDIATLARHTQVQEQTVRKWIKAGAWQIEAESVENLQQEIENEADQALLTALREYKKDPSNKDLQSLRGMLKEYMERRKPDKKILEYILKFQEEVIAYAIETGNETLRKHYQASLVDFSEWLRKKYVSI